MSKPILLLLLSFWCSINSFGQLYMTRNGFIGFYSKTAMEDIAAENNQVYAVVDASKKNLAFSLLMKGFIFRKELMQVHFNENYIESDKYPKASFSGTYTADPGQEKNGAGRVLVRGNLSIHHITRAIEIPAQLQWTDGKLNGSAEFKVRPEDFDIKIPSIVRDKISEFITVHVKVDCNIVK